MKYLLDTDFAIDEIHVLYRSDTDTDDILILIIPIPIPIPITYHLKFIPPAVATDGIPILMRYR